jgi:hypothetical protein
MTPPDGTSDQIMARIGQAIALGHQGDRATARAHFAETWAMIGAEGDPLHRCALAHSMADVQDDVQAELAWDLRALAAADAVTDERVRQAGMVGTARALYPSLHLNLGEAYRKAGDPERARAHLDLGTAAAGHLGTDGYAEMIRTGLRGLAARLERTRQVSPQRPGPRRY